MRRHIIVTSLLAALLGSAAVHAADKNFPNAAEWRFYGGNSGGDKYSPLDQINAQNVKDLKVVWRQKAAPAEALLGNDPPKAGNYQLTPLMVDGLLYIRTETGPVAALEPTTGKVVWVDKKAEGVGRSRGVAYWSDGKDARIFALDGSDLVALNAKTGERYPGFGADGRVDLKVYADPRPNSPVGSFSWSSFPVVVGDIIVIAGVPLIDKKKVPAGITPALDAPGDIRGYDARTGKLVWTFHVIPRKGEFGYDTWANGSADMNGGVGPWSWLTADQELGYVYLPMQASTNDFYGGHRPGDNLFANAVVCLDAKTGKRVWHYQLIRHDIWDFDNPTGPILTDITVDGKKIKAVVQLTKQSYAYVLDRTNGKPVWPIEDKPVPAGNVPGEWYSPTQPIPSKPPAFEMQSLSTDDLIDFTPELRAAAIEEMSKYTAVPVFTPANLDKEIAMTPGTIGGADWQGGAFDPETGMLYISATRNIVRTMIIKTNPNSPFAYDRKNEPMLKTNIELPYQDIDPTKPVGPDFLSRLPITKPPYGSIVAMDLNKGDISWRVPNGDGPRNHPALKYLNLPPLGTPNRASPLLTKTLLFMGEGQRGPNGAFRVPSWGGGKKFRAFDKKDGKVIWEMDLPGGTSGAPMTYMAGGKQYIVVAVGWDDMDAELVALALP
jgi:quinoprotein glucose dehydrogenase